MVFSKSKKKKKEIVTLVTWANDYEHILKKATGRLSKFYCPKKYKQCTDITIYGCQNSHHLKFQTELFITIPALSRPGIAIFSFVLKNPRAG